jgi:hypothetical protein
LTKKNLAGLLALTAASFAVNGYHPFSEDAETYLPGVEKLLNPHLFPAGTEYFQMHAHMTVFPQLIAYTVWITHLSLPWALLLWQVASYFLFILACWKLASRVISGAAATWAAVSLVVVLSTMPVAGTALYLMDPFLNPRNIIAFALVFGVLKTIERRYLQAGLFLLFAISINPLMGAYPASFCVLVVVMDRWKAFAASSARRRMEIEAAPAAPALLLFSPFKGLFRPPDGGYDLVAANHRYQFLARWTWYEMLGAIGPIFIFWWFSAIARARRLKNLELLSRAMMIYGAIYFVLGLIVSIPRRLEVISLVQPMRSLQLEYVLMLLFAGGLLGEYLLRNRIWRWVALFLPLSAGMCYAQRALYPASPQIEWPGAKPQNPWVQAFQWARENTPDQAIFAIDPHYMGIAGEDSNGFRAIAERSQLADDGKDSGVVELFPQLAPSWLTQVQAQTGIDQFHRADFVRLERQFGVRWAVLRQPGHENLDCPYKNSVVMVCRLP